VTLARDLPSEKNFITELEAVVAQFYDHVGQHLKAWQPTAPRLSEAKAEPSSVNTGALRDAAGQEAVTALPADRPSN
jgi:hypothetical protein